MFIFNQPAKSVNEIHQQLLAHLLPDGEIVPIPRSKKFIIRKDTISKSIELKDDAYSLRNQQMYLEIGQNVSGFRGFTIPSGLSLVKTNSVDIWVHINYCWHESKKAQKVWVFDANRLRKYVQRGVLDKSISTRQTRPGKNGNKEGYYSIGGILTEKQIIEAHESAGY